MDVLQTEKNLMKLSMSEKDERIENFEENMKIRETELIDVYRKDFIFYVPIGQFFDSFQPESSRDLQTRCPLYNSRQKKND